MFWGNDDEERRKRDEEERRRKREEQERKDREASEAKRKAKAAVKARAVKQKRIDRERKELEEIMGSQMDEFGGNQDPLGEKKEETNETNMLGRGMLDSIFGASNSSYAMTRASNQQLHQPGKPVIGHQKGEIKPKEEKQDNNRDLFNGQPVPKLWRPF